MPFCSPRKRHSRCMRVVHKHLRARSEWHWLKRFSQTLSRALSISTPLCCMGFDKAQNKARDKDALRKLLKSGPFGVDPSCLHGFAFHVLSAGRRFRKTITGDPVTTLSRGTGLHVAITVDDGRSLLCHGVAKRRRIVIRNRRRSRQPACVSSLLASQSPAGPST